MPDNSEAPHTTTGWERSESIARIASAIAIPVVIAIGGWWIQNSITEQSISKDYVALAVGVLEKPKAQIDQGLRDWAVDILDDYAPRKFSPDTVARLKAGSIQFTARPMIVPSPYGSAGSFVASGHVADVAGRSAGEQPVEQWA